MSHEIVKCSCGALIAQCRCFLKDKPVRIVQNGCHDCNKNASPTGSSWKNGAEVPIEEYERKANPS